MIAQGLIFYAKDPNEIPMGSPPVVVPKAGGIGKKLHFAAHQEVCSSDVLLPKICVSIHHGGPHPRR